MSMQARPAVTGRIIRRRSRSSPRSNSRRASSPTTRKNNAISPLFTQVRRSRSADQGPIRTARTQSQKASYWSVATFAQISASTIAAARMAALAASVRRKARSGLLAGPTMDIGRSPGSFGFMGA